MPESEASEEAAEPPHPARASAARSAQSLMFLGRSSRPNGSLPGAEVVGARHGGDDLGLVRSLASERAERRELPHDNVAIPFEALVAAAGEEERLAADERAVALVHRRGGGEGCL